MSSKQTTRMFGVLLAALFLAAAPLRAAETDGITVIGNGEAKSRPTQVEISGLVAGDAELAADAIVKYRDAKKHAVDALTNLKLPSLVIESQGFTVNQALDPNMQAQVMRGMNPGNNAKAKVQVAEQIRLVLKDLDKIESEKLMDTLLKVLDTAKDNGLVVGPGLPQNYYQWQMAMQQNRGQSMISFKLPDPKELRDAAFKDAMENAKARAARLAELSGVKLGKIISVREGAPSQNTNVNINYDPWGNAIRGQAEGSDLTSQMFTEIPLKVALTVQFEIVK
ncbi:MAG TPA: SIMPL domain-containing protein [Tepidisphaeraceae bacterium]|jgi:uncharacterized protein YggE|nr:SIMPL domain-containing protein [Tepidisphaeraceae bacterium]